jgi:hypothetical protein
MPETITPASIIARSSQRESPASQPREIALKKIYNPLSVAMSAALVGLSTLFILYRMDTAHLFWDLKIYTRAANDFAQHHDPYRIDVKFLFIYHPYILDAFGWMNNISDIKSTLLIFYASSLVLFIKNYTKSDSLYGATEHGPRHKAIWALVATLGFGSATWSAIGSGNITLYVHLLLIGIFLASARNSSARWILAFCTAVLFSIILKPYFAAYLILLPFILGPRQSAAIGALIIAMAALLWFSALISSPDRYANFISALSYQTLFKGDLGYGAVGMLRQRIGPTSAASVHLMMIFAAALCSLFFLRKSGRELLDKANIPLAIVFAIILNPRMKEYDLCVAVLLSYEFIRIRLPEAFWSAVSFSLALANFPEIAYTLARWGGIHVPDIFLVNNYMQSSGFVAIFALTLLAARAKSPLDHPRTHLSS